MKTPLEIHIRLRGTYRETIRAVSKALRNTDRELMRPYGPQIEYGENGEKIALVYRIDSPDLYEQDVFSKEAKIVEV